MTKEYIRKCDYCEKVIENMYDYGVTTLFKDIRIGRGHQFHDYQEGHINNKMIHKTPDDYDHYGKGWSNDENKEFNFCSPDCLANFFLELYEDTYKSGLKALKILKEKDVDDELKRMKERHNGFINKLAEMYQSKLFKQQARKDIKIYIGKLQEELKELGEK
jgi:hypothetical protein